MGKQIVGLTEIRQLPPVIQLADNGSPVQISAITSLCSQHPHCLLHRQSIHSYLLSVQQA